MIRIWKIQKFQIKELYFADQSSLDAVTRQLPDGYYSTFRTYAQCTHVLGLSAHLRRLPNINASVLRRNLIQALEYFRPDEARVRVISTKNKQLYIAVEMLNSLPTKVYEEGVRAEIATLRRNSPRIKSTSFIGRSEGERRHMAQVGVFESLLVKNDRILEGITSNFFYVIDSVLHTAQRDILLGVTRRTVLRVAHKTGVEVRYLSLKLQQLPAVEEAFLTSSTRGVVPIVQIDDVKIAGGRPGRITQMLLSGYEKYVLAHAERIDHGT